MVHSIKHYVQLSISTVLTTARNAEVIAVTVNQASSNLGEEVQEGSSIKAIFLEVWVIGSSADQFFTATVSKQVSGASAPTSAQMADLFTYPNKKNIFYTTQGLAPNDGVGQPIPLYRGWIKIPKSKQRFGLGDALAFCIRSGGDATLTYCGFATYKEYT